MTEREKLTEEEKTALENELAFLKMHMPNNIEEDGTKILRDVNDFRLKIIFSQRSAVIFNTKIKEIEQGNMTNSQIQQIFNSKTIEKTFLSPKLCQQTSLFMTYLFGSLDVFANSVLSYKKHENFWYLVNVSIPALFAYFTSYEIVQHAMLFYMHILNGSDVNVSIQLLTPFLNSVLSFRFIEGIIEKFIPKFSADVRTNSCKKYKASDLKHFANFLISCIRESISLLPKYFATIFHLIKSQKWTNEECAKLFFDNFFKNQSELYIKGMAYSQFLPKYREILQYIRSSDNILNELLSFVFTNDSSSYQLISMYSPFDQTYVTTLISVYDISIIHHCLVSSSNTFPGSVRELDIKTTNPETPFFINIFTKTYSISRIRFAQIIFEESQPIENKSENEYVYMYRKLESDQRTEIETAYELSKKISSDQCFIEFCLIQSVNKLRSKSQLFERLIWYKMHLSFIEEWNLISEDYLEKRKIIAVDHMKILEDGTPISAFSTVFNAESGNFYQRLFINSKMPLISRAVSYNKSEFNALFNCWNQLIKSKKASLNMSPVNSLSEGAKKVFWTSVELFNTMDCLDQDKRLFVLFRAIDVLFMIPADNKFRNALAGIAITFAAPLKLIITFIVYSTFVMSNNEFTCTLSENSLLNWTSFQSFLIKFVFSSEVPQMQHIFVHLQQLLNSFECSPEHDI